MLRKKESEVEYLQKQVRCLQNEVQSLTKVLLIPHDFNPAYYNQQNNVKTSFNKDKLYQYVVHHL